MRGNPSPDEHVLVNQFDDRGLAGPILADDEL
jgi:hypothetical protein